MILKRPMINTEQDIIDKACVKELIEFERFCRDNALWGEMHKCFTENSVVNISWYQGSGHGFVEASAKMQGRAPHKIYNTEIWLNGNKAVAIMVVTIQKRDIIDGCQVELQSDAKLVFRTRKINDMWYIESMEAIYEKDAIIPVLPTTEINIPNTEINRYRDSYACLSYILSRQGHNVCNDLPGIDRPELVEKLYREADSWLIGK